MPRGPFTRKVLGAVHTGLFGAVFAVNGVVFTSTAYVPLSLLSMIDPRAKAPVRAYSQGVYQALIKVLSASGALRIAEFHNVERLRRGGPMVVVANHRTLLDVLILMAEIPDSSCLLKPFRPTNGQVNSRRSMMPWFWKYFIGAPFSMLDYVSMPADWDDTSAVAAVFDACREILKAGRPLVLFPEGTRSTLGHLLPMRDLAFRLALDAGVPLVPVGIHTQVKFSPQGSHTLSASEPCDFRFKVFDDIVPDPSARPRDLLMETRRIFQTFLRDMNEKYGYKD